MHVKQQPNSRRVSQTVIAEIIGSEAKIGSCVEYLSPGFANQVVSGSSLLQIVATYAGLLIKDVDVVVSPALAYRAMSYPGLPRVSTSVGVR